MLPYIASLFVMGGVGQSKPNNVTAFLKPSPLSYTFSPLKYAYAKTLDKLICPGNIMYGY